MYLHNNKDLFSKLIEDAGQYLHIENAYIEKDYYVTLFLKELSHRLPNLLFKGGTSLSKCQKVVNRFSEDIDLTLTQEVVTQGQRKKLKLIIKDVINELDLSFLNESETRSRRDYNCYEIDYDPLYTSPTLKRALLVETVFMLWAYPYETCNVSSLIYDYLEATDNLDLVADYDVAPFPISVQTLERTLADKIFALCDYHISGKITAHSRHIYDIYKLLDRVELNDEFAELFKRVRKDRAQGSDRCFSAKEEYSISALLQEIIDNKTYVRDYNNITAYIIFDDVPYKKAITGLQKLIDSGILG